MSHSTEIKVRALQVELFVLDLTRGPAEKLNIYAGKERVYRNEDALAAYARMSCRLSRSARRCIEAVVDESLADSHLGGIWLALTVKHCDGL